MLWSRRPRAAGVGIAFEPESSPIRWLLFESRIALLTALGLVEFVLLWIWARRRTRRTRRRAGVGLVVAGLLLSVQALVVTDREKIMAICREMACAVEEGAVDQVGRHVASDFAAGGVDRAGLLAGLTRMLTHVHIEEPRLSDFEVLVTGNEAQVTFQARCRVASAELVEGGIISRWELTFRRVGDRWQVVAIQPLPTLGFPFQNLGEVLRVR